MLFFFYILSSAILEGNVLLSPSFIQFLGLCFAIGVFVPCPGIYLNPEFSTSRFQVIIKNKLMSNSSADNLLNTAVRCFSGDYSPPLPLWFGNLSDILFASGLDEKQESWHS